MKSILVALLSFALSCSPAVRQPDPLGLWKVLDHRFGKISALDSAAAEAWHGETAEFSSEIARFMDFVCRDPKYSRREFAASEYLADQYRADSRSVGIDSTSLEVVEILCAGEPWNAPGATLLLVSDSRLLLPWDGVFFILERSK